MSAQASAGSVASEALPVSPSPGDALQGGQPAQEHVQWRVEVAIDSEGWVVLDRCGRHFGLVLNFLRDGSVPLPDSQRELEEVLKEAQYYGVQGLVQHCLNTVKKRTDGFEGACRIPMITSAKEEQRMIASCRKPVVKLQNNRGNNKYSYTSNSDDNLLKNIELFDKLGLFGCSSSGTCWGADLLLVLQRGRKGGLCTSIVATEKKQTKVEFPEARIFEETLNILIYENGRGSGPGRGPLGIGRGLRGRRPIGRRRAPGRGRGPPGKADSRAAAHHARRERTRAADRVQGLRPGGGVPVGVGGAGSGRSLRRGRDDERFQTYGGSEMGGSGGGALLDERREDG
ncbi:hypothetical protein ANANG_G00286450 [Anguilla anguilla]|uniref:Potassium channel tetramerisation-type BTB domain-containing protein n=1 Tax=Anguilla anguilla TaxID=7936 RepID=A0A9D3LKU8_ANGAN|nr:hypothetical protein ANANG_G00286450 [Anguilla anguilla]